MGTLKPLTLFDPAFDVPSVFKGLLPPMWMEAERMRSRHQAGRGGGC